MAALYALTDAVSTLWEGRRYPTQAEIDDAFTDHYRSDARIRTAELHRDGAYLATVCHAENSEGAGA